MEGELTPEEIDLDHAPRRRLDVTSVEIDEDLMLYEPDSGDLHKLNAMAALLWERMDGSLTLREFVAALDEAVDEDVERVQRDVLAYTRELARAGLLVGVRPDGPDGPPTASVDRGP